MLYHVHTLSALTARGRSVSYLPNHAVFRIGGLSRLPYSVFVEYELFASETFDKWIDSVTSGHTGEGGGDDTQHEVNEFSVFSGLRVRARNPDSRDHNPSPQTAIKSIIRFCIR